MLVHTTDGMALRIGQNTNNTEDYIGFLIEKILSCHRYHRFGNTVASNQQKIPPVCGFTSWFTSSYDSRENCLPARPWRTINKQYINIDSFRGNDLESYEYKIEHMCALFILYLLMCDEWCSYHMCYL